MSTPAPHPQDSAELRAIAAELKRRLPPGIGFFVLIAPFDTEDGRANYVSNITRETAILMMKEFLLKAGAAEDWMQHIK